MPRMIYRVFIGRDPRQPLAYNVLANSIIDHASVPVEIIALSLKALPMKRQGLTEFTFSRFLVPYLCNFEGTAVFLDADMVVTGDIKELFACADGKSSVQVNKKQDKFEWPSAMLFNCEHCKMLTPEYIDNPRNTCFGMEWATSGVGSFPEEWNFCCPYSGNSETAKLYHYTQGIPAWKETRGKPEDKFWFSAYKSMIHTVSFQELMGNSVHVERMIVNQ